MSSSSAKALCIERSRAILLTTMGGELTYRSPRMPRTPGEYKLPLKARWPRFAKSVVCTIITNAEQPDNAIRTHPGLSSEVSPSRVVMHGYGSISCQCRFRTSSMTLDRVSLRRSGRMISIFCRHSQSGAIHTLDAYFSPALALIANSPNVPPQVAPCLAVPFEGKPFLCSGMVRED
jgi:hypothetical protein